MFKPLGLMSICLLMLIPNLDPKAGKTAEDRPGKFFDDLIGRWEVHQQIRQQDGSWRASETDSEWRFYSILGGEAIQDDWKSVKTDTAGNEIITQGTNIRIYNPEKEAWVMAWIDSKNRSLATFTATESNGTLTMEGHNAVGRPVRNTFFEVNADSFRWVQEWTFDDGKTWIEVSRIRCARID